MRSLRIGNAQGFWGDDSDAPARLVSRASLDVLTLDYLAEVSMSILARQKSRDASLGYARDFLDVLKSLIPFLRDGGKVITNAGGLNPRECSTAATGVLRDAGLSGVRIGIVSGDDVLPEIRSALEADPHTHRFAHLESAQPISTIADRLVTANAYIGAAPVVRCLSEGAQIVIGGRIADPSLTVAPAMAHFGWSETDWDRIAGATIAGHLIECGTQSVGGISTHWMEINHDDIGFPIVEITADGSCTLTKPDGTGGEVSERTVKEQLLYEIGDPGNYRSPDATVSFLRLRLKQDGPDRVRITGASGGPPTGSYKVSATYKAGYRASGMLTIVGRGAVAKAREAAAVVERKLRRDNKLPQRWWVECLGSGDASLGLLGRREDLSETVLRISVADERRDIVEHFTKQMIPLVTAGPQGTTGYAEGRPTVREAFAYWPCLIERHRVKLSTEVITV
ncbi:MAG: DUF1446 domain-containing protein [Phycisphaerae bacterium]|nr:DUF1446 domain-containing protein [Phycisphaerae bacterium]MDW8262290.1 acyclic terpene utilization AtuA family protein [Phycisphaerales bacterium]